MRKALIVCCFVPAILASHAMRQADQATSNLSQVDLTIGTVGVMLEPTRPLTHLPHSMVRMYPGRRDQLDDQIGWFPLTISSHRQPAVLGLMPYSGAIDASAHDTRFTYDFEQSTPYSYNVLLDEADIRVTFAPAARSGMFRFAFGRPGAKYLRLSILGQEGTTRLDGTRAFSGSERVKGTTKGASAVTVYFHAETDVDLEAIVHRDELKGDALFQLSPAATDVTVRYGVSFISVGQARANLRREIRDWDIERIAEEARSAWSRNLDRIQVRGGTPEQRRVFFTALYRTQERMVDINEYGQYFSAFDGQVHRSAEPFYIDNWVWDSHIAQEPLETILDPAMQAAKIRSYVEMYKQSGRMPTYALPTGHASMMNGNHFAPIAADAWFKGIRAFDLAAVYDGLKKNSLQTTKLPDTFGPLTSLDVFYNEQGFMPGLHPGERETVDGVSPVFRRQSVSVTLEHSYDDWCIAMLARDAGHAGEVPLFLARSRNYRNVYREDKGFMWPKDINGNWIEPFDPKFAGGQGGRDYTAENNVYTYNWSVKHDLEGLVALMGGRNAAEAKLDDLFRADIGRPRYHYWDRFPDATGLVGQFSMGNEPSFHIPFLYNYTGSPWKTQKRIRMLLDAWFPATLFGMPGDEDGGAMSAFVLFAMMGFFPVTPGLPVYNIGSPVFDEVIVHLPDGKAFTIAAVNNSGDNKFIQRAVLNGQLWNKPWFTHADIVNGATLTLEMGDRPNRTWGAGRSASPPSSLSVNPAAY